MPTEITAYPEDPTTGFPPLPIEDLGSTTCEDSAIVRSRLEALGIPFRDVDVDADPGAAQRTRDLNGGHRPRVTSHAAEAGGLVDPSGAVEWLRFLALECPECSGEIEWPGDG